MSDRALLTYPEHAANDRLVWVAALIRVRSAEYRHLFPRLHDTCLCTAVSYGRWVVLHGHWPEAESAWTPWTLACLLMALQIHEQDDQLSLAINHPNLASLCPMSVLSETTTLLASLMALHHLPAFHGMDAPHRIALGLATDARLFAVTTVAQGPLADDLRLALWDLCNDLCCTRCPLWFSSWDLAVAAVALCAAKHNVGVDLRWFTTVHMSPSALRVLVSAYRTDVQMLSRQMDAFMFIDNDHST